MNGPVDTGSPKHKDGNVRSNAMLEKQFQDATTEEINCAVSAAMNAFQIYRQTEPALVAKFLRRISAEILALGVELIETASYETSLPHQRLEGERTRTIRQIEMFADLVEEGSWVDARIDRADPDRQPLPKPDIRRTSIPVGPVVVFGASNFPLAFSVAGGDTASALAARNPVIVKSHPYHPATSQLVAGAIDKAVQALRMPHGLFHLLHGSDPNVGLSLVSHPEVSAVAFTGSLKAGRALFDVAAQRKRPIPVYAEMGSVNPVFLLPDALNEKSQFIAQQLVDSVTLGVGQFCTKPGLVFYLASSSASFEQAVCTAISLVKPGVMLHPRITDNYKSGLAKLKELPGVDELRGHHSKGISRDVLATILRTDAKTFLQTNQLQEELFGPAALLISCADATQLKAAADVLGGNLATTIYATEQELVSYGDLLSALQQKTGRLVLNAMPTGVEVCPSMQHGGPYPATTCDLFTSVGTAAIERFARPVCYQGFPQAALPEELRDDNPRQITRTVNGRLETVRK